MGRFDRFIERATKPPSGVMRVFGVVLPVLWIAKAAQSRRLEDILIAAFMVVFLLPSGIAPEAYRVRLAALNKHRVLSSALAFVLLTGMLFAGLVEFLGLSRLTSVLIAVSFALAATFVGALRQRARDS